MKRALVVAAWAGLAALQYGIAVAYHDRGTWWHYLLHQMVGWGVGLAAAGAWTAGRRGRSVPPVAAALAGQLVSIVPDLMFRYGRMPHTAAMDLWLGHISIHRGPSPVLVALGVVLLGGAGWLSSAYGRRRPALGLAVATAALLTGACLLAEPVPTRLADY
jgi:hypothetical protein